jgi:hypothetical protein
MCSGYLDIDNTNVQLKWATNCVKVQCMEKGQVIETLRRHEPELKAAGIVHLRLFGSVARGEASIQSDVDLIADFDRSMRLTLFAMARLENRLSDLLGAKVDLSPAGSLKERVRARALREAVDAF